MNKRIFVQQGNITDLEIDCVVSPGNQKLLAGGGVCGEIFKKAGLIEIRKACYELGYCGIGQAVITSGFALKAKHIIHTVGPQWQSKNAVTLLEVCYRNCLLKAEQNDIKSIAFPIISAGSHGFPEEVAAKIAVTSIKKYLKRHDDSKIEKIVLIANNTKMYNLLKKSLSID